MKQKVLVLLLLGALNTGCYKSKPKTSSCAQKLIYKSDTQNAGEDAIYQGTGYFMNLAYGEDNNDFLAKVDTATSSLVLNDETAPGQRTFKPFVYSFGSKLGQAARTKTDLDMVCGNDLNIGFAILEDNIEMPNVIGLSYGDPDRFKHEKKLKPFFDQIVEKYGYQDIFSLSLCVDSDNSNIIIGGFDENVPLLATIPIIEKTSFTVPALKILRSDTKKILGTFPIYDSSDKNSIKTILDSSSTFTMLPVEVTNAIVDEIIQRAQNLGLASSFPVGFFNTQRGSGTIPVKFADLKQLKQFPSFEIEFLDSFGEKKYLSLMPEYYFKSVDPNDKLIRIFTFRQTQGTITLGQPFMENHYMVFDRENGIIGFGDINRACKKK